MPPQDPTPQTQTPKMSTGEFAAWLKKQDPELAEFPDDALVKGVLARRPDLRSRIDMSASTGGGGGGISNLVAQARQAGFQGEDLVKAVAVGMAESSGNPAARNPSGATGLWQILPSAHPEFDVNQLTDPAYNARAAYGIFQKAGGFSPWEAFTKADPNDPRKKMYEKYMQQARTETGVWPRLPTAASPRQPEPPDPEAGQEWLRENVTGFLKQLASIPRTMWQRGVAPYYDPKLWAQREKEYDEENKMLGQLPLTEGAKYVFNKYVNPVMKRDTGTPSERINWGGTTANVLPYLLAARDYPASRSGARLSEGLGESAEGQYRTRLQPEEAAKQITDLVKPEAIDRVRYEENMTNELAKVRQFVRTHGMNLTSPRDFLKAIQGTHSEIRKYFYQSILDPVGEAQVTNTSIPGYQGGTVAAEAGTRSASSTLNQLDKRLSEVNAELDAGYRKEAVDKGVTLRSEPELRAEAAGIRQVYYRELAKQTELKESELRQMRESVGALGELAAKTQKAVSAAEDRAITTRNARGRTTINPFAREGQRFVADVAWQKLMDAMIGDPYERQIGRTGKQIGKITTSRARTAPVAVPGAGNLPEPTPTPIEQLTPQQQEAIRQVAGLGERTMGRPAGTVEMPSEGEIASQRLRQAQRAEAVRQARESAQARTQARALRGRAGPGEPAGTVERPSPAEVEAQMRKLAERGKRVREAKEARARRIKEARERRRRPAEE